MLFLAALAAPAAAVKPAVLLGTWEAARTPEDERLFVRLPDQARVQIAAEYDFQIAGQAGKDSKSRIRSTILWKAPHDYQLAPPPEPAAPARPAPFD